MFQFLKALKNFKIKNGNENRLQLNGSIKANGFLYTDPIKWHILIVKQHPAVESIKSLFITFKTFLPKLLLQFQVQAVSIAVYANLDKSASYFWGVLTKYMLEN